MKNRISQGQTLDLIAPKKLESGELTRIEGLAVVPVTSAAEGELVAVEYRGIFRFPKIDTLEATTFQKAYLKKDTNELATTKTDNDLIGVFIKAEAGQEYAEVLLTGQPF